MTDPDRAEHIDPRTLLGGLPSDLYFPRYRRTGSGARTVEVVGMPAARGYWGQVYPLFGAVIMAGPADDDRRSWMSMLPAERESQEIGLRAAHGHTVVFGLGMGWLAANVAMRPSVERDTAVFALIADQRVFASLPEDVRRMQTNVGAGEIYILGTGDGDLAVFLPPGRRLPGSGLACGQIDRRRGSATAAGAPGLTRLSGTDLRRRAVVDAGRCGDWWRDGAVLAA